MKQRIAAKGLPVTIAAALLVFIASASAAFVGLPGDGSRLDNDPSAGISPAKDAGVVDTAGGALTPGAPAVPWATFEKATSGEPQIFVRAFKNGAWSTQGSGTVGGASSASPFFSGSLNFDQSKQGEAPAIDFAGTGRAVPWATWYEDNTTPFNHKEVFASRFNGTTGKWFFAGQGRPGTSGPPSLNLNTAHDAEDPAVAGGATVAGADPGPWITWQELDPSKNQIFVVKPIKLASGVTTCPVGTKPTGGNAVGGFCWQQVGVERANGNSDPSLNIDPTRDGIEANIAFTGPNDTVPWVVWYEQNPGANGISNELVFAAKASSVGAPAGTVDGGFHWEAVGGGTASPQILDTGANCRSSAAVERSCSLNGNTTSNAEDPRVAAGTMSAGQPTVPWVVWSEQVGGVFQIFSSRLVGGTHFVLANSGQPLSSGAGDATRPDITFSRNTPYVTWHQVVGGVKRVVGGHLVNPANPTFVLDTPGGITATSAGSPLDTRATVSSTCTANPFNADGGACQGGAIGTPFFLFNDGNSGAQALFSQAFQPAGLSTHAAIGLKSKSGKVAGLVGSVDPGGAPVAVHFDYGPVVKKIKKIKKKHHHKKKVTITKPYTAQTPEQLIGAVNGATLFGAVVTNLKPGHLFHFRAVVRTDFGTITGNDVVFKPTRKKHKKHHKHKKHALRQVAATELSVDGLVSAASSGVAR